MDAYECIMTRRSIRKYQDLPVPWEYVGKIIDAGKAAPSAGNLQDYRFIVVTKDTIRQAISEACLQQYWMAIAPVHIVVCSVPEHSKRFYGIRGERLYSIQSCAAAIQNMMLTAHEFGLGSCWIGAFEESMLKKACGIPDSARPQGIIPIGYPDEKVPTPVKYKMTDICYLEKFGNKLLDPNAFAGYTSADVKKVINAGKEMIKKIHKKIKGE